MLSDSRWMSFGRWVKVALLKILKVANWQMGLQERPLHSSYRYCCRLRVNQPTTSLTDIQDHWVWSSKIENSVYYRSLMLCPFVFSCVSFFPVALTKFIHWKDGEGRRLGNAEEIMKQPQLVSHSVRVRIQVASSSPGTDGTRCRPSPSLFSDSGSTRLCFPE